MYTEKKHRDRGALPPQGDCWSGLNPPILSTNNKVTGATTNMLLKGGKNATPVRRMRYHNHIGLLMKEILSCQLSYHHLESIKITCDCRVCQFITQLMKTYKICNGRITCKEWKTLDQGRNSCGSDEGSSRVIFSRRSN